MQCMSYPAADHTSPCSPWSHGAHGLLGAPALPPVSSPPTSHASTLSLFSTPPTGSRQKQHWAAKTDATPSPSATNCFYNKPQTHRLLLESPTPLAAHAAHAVHAAHAWECGPEALALLSPTSFGTQHAAPWNEQPSQCNAPPPSLPPPITEVTQGGSRCYTNLSWQSSEGGSMHVHLVSSPPAFTTTSSCVDPMQPSPTRHAPAAGDSTGAWGLAPGFAGRGQQESQQSVKRQALHSALGAELPCSPRPPTSLVGCTAKIDM